MKEIKYKPGKVILNRTGYYQFYFNGKLLYKGYLKNGNYKGYMEVTKDSWVNTGIKYRI